MNLPVTVWGVHMGEHVGSRPIDLGYVAIGWPALGDLRQYPDRDALRAALEVRYAEKKTRFTTCRRRHLVSICL